MPPCCVFYISGHGLGHASRDIEVINRLATEAPDYRVIVRTGAPRWLFDLACRVPVDLQAAEVDTGVVQIDSLRLDPDATARQAAAFYATFDARVGTEVAFLRSVGATVVVGDIPPLAFAAAARAGIPSLAVANFTWDWIYADYPSFASVAHGVVPIIGDAYRLATRTLRLPIHGGFETMAATLADVPFIARRSARDPEETRRRLGLPGGRPIVLASFGGYGATLPCERVAATSPLTIVTTDRSSGDGPEASHLVRLDERVIYDKGLLYEDLVRAVDVVLTKPGYGIVSECVANGTAMVYTSRGHFIEYDVFVEEMPRFLRCAFISHEDLFGARWTNAVQAALAQPAPAERPRIDGAEVVVQEILNLR